MISKCFQAVLAGWLISMVHPLAPGAQESCAADVRHTISSAATGWAGALTKLIRPDTFMCSRSLKIRSRRDESSVYCFRQSFKHQKR